MATAPSPASSGTSLVVASSDGTLFPAVPFNATVWPAGQPPTAANAEIVRVTGRATDTFTITRATESSSARAIVVGDQIAATITAKTLTDIENAVPPSQVSQVHVSSGAIAASGSATNIVSVTISGLTRLDVLTSRFMLECSGQAITAALLYDASASVSLFDLLNTAAVADSKEACGIVDLFNAAGSATKQIAIGSISVDSGAGVVQSTSNKATTGASTWTGTWTLAVRVTLTGSANVNYRLIIEKHAGQ